MPNNECNFQLFKSTTPRQARPVETQISNLKKGTSSHCRKMRKIRIAEIFGKSFPIRTAPPTLFHYQKASKGPSELKGNIAEDSIRNRSSRSISMSSAPGSVSVTSILPPITVKLSPLLNTLASPVPNLYNPNHAEKPNIIESSVEEQEYYPVEQERSRSQYLRMLDSAIQQLLPNESKSVLTSELSVKRVLGKNEEMKKVIFKVAAAALENTGHKGRNHPFLMTAGEVFFMESYTNPNNCPEDIMTPGILVLLFDFILNPKNTHLHQKPMFLAKAIVETCAGYLLHRTVQEADDHSSPQDSLMERLHQGNKLATLTGDLLVVSLIRHVASTGNNKVLELVMNSLSEFPNTEIGSQQAFQTSPNGTTVKALLPPKLAESFVLSEAFKGTLVLSGVEDQALLSWAEKLGQVTGLLWKTNFDYVKLISSENLRVENPTDLNLYLQQLTETGENLLDEALHHKGSNPAGISTLKNLLHYWGSRKE